MIRLRKQVRKTRPTQQRTLRDRAKEETSHRQAQAKKSSQSLCLPATDIHERREHVGVQLTSVALDLIMSLVPACPTAPTQECQLLLLQAAPSKRQRRKADLWNNINQEDISGTASLSSFTSSVLTCCLSARQLSMSKLRLHRCSFEPRLRSPHPFETKLACKGTTHLICLYFKTGTSHVSAAFYTCSF